MAPAPSPTKEDLHLSFVKSVIAGVMAAPVCLVLQTILPRPSVPIMLFGGSGLSAVASIFIECVLKNMSWTDTFVECVLGGFSFAFGGIFPMLAGMLCHDRPLRIAFAIITCGLITAMVIMFWTFKGTEDSPERRTTTICIGWVWFVSMIGTGVFVAVADKVK